MPSFLKLVAVPVALAVYHGPIALCQPPTAPAESSEEDSDMMPPSCSHAGTSDQLFPLGQLLPQLELQSALNVHLSQRHTSLRTHCLAVGTYPYKHAHIGHRGMLIIQKRLQAHLSVQDKQKAGELPWRSEIWASCPCSYRNLDPAIKVNMVNACF